MGEYRHTIDEKGRLTIPSSWRPGSADDPERNNFLALPNPGGYVTVYPPKMIRQLEERISQISIGDTEGQDAVTELMAMAHDFACDKHGRINLNDKLIHHAGIRKNVVLLGKLSNFSIYSEEAYNAVREGSGRDAASTAEIFKRFGL